MQVTVQVTVNGTPRELPAGATVSDLVRALELRPEIIAVERNRELVPRTAHAQVALSDGDQLEVVTLVGGG